MHVTWCGPTADRVYGAVGVDFQVDNNSYATEVSTICNMAAADWQGGDGVTKHISSVNYEQLVPVASAPVHRAFYATNIPMLRNDITF